MKKFIELNIFLTFFNIGLTKDHPQCFTLFSCSNYCLSGNKAAVLILNQDDKKLSEVHVFSTTEHLRYKENSTEQKKTLIGTFKKFLNKEAHDLIKLFRQKDSANSDSIKASEWSAILSQHISKKYDNKIDAEHFLTLRNHLCPSDDGSNMINYMRIII